MECPTCGKTYSGKGGVTIHHSQAHGEQYISAVLRNKIDGDAAQWLRSEYHGSERSLEDIASELEENPKAIRKMMDDYGVETRKPNHKKPVWFGMDRSRDFWYECWKHNMTEGTKKVWLHRLLAVAEHGFDEVAGNDIHHKNELTWDNRPENLEVMGHGEHRSHHHNNNNNAADE